MAIPPRHLRPQRCSPQEGSPLLGPSGLPSWGGLPFLSSPRWRGRGLFFLLLVFVGGVCFGVIGQGIQHYQTLGTLSRSRGLLLGLLLRHHVRCRDQQLRQACVCWAFRQRSRTVDLSGLLLPVLLKEWEFRSRIESNYEKQIPCIG